MTERGRNVTEDDDQRPMLPLAEAAERMGRHPEALRSLVRRKRVRAVRGNLGWLVAVDDREPTGAPTGDGRPDDRGLADAVAELKDELAEMRDRVTRAEGERDRAEALAAERVAGRERYIAQLETLLAEARKSWLRRLLGR